jgi:hypothetical protein
MEMVRLNLVYDLLQKAKLSSIIHIKREDDKVPPRYFSQVHFVICNRCYWCVSYFGIDDLSPSSSPVLDCHVCNSHNTELMPVSADESFRIEHGMTRGMELEFYKNNNVVARQQQQL